MIELIRASTGKMPQIIGKPNRTIIDSAFSGSRYERQAFAMVGDRVYTDIKTGVNAGICSILSCRGSRRQKILIVARYKFCLDICRSLKEYDAHPISEASAGISRCHNGAGCFSCFQGLRAD